MLYFPIFLIFCVGQIFGWSIVFGARDVSRRKTNYLLRFCRFAKNKYDSGVFSIIWAIFGWISRKGGQKRVAQAVYTHDKRIMLYLSMPALLFLCFCPELDALHRQSQARQTREHAHLCWVFAARGVAVPRRSLHCCPCFPFRVPRESARTRRLFPSEAAAAATTTTAGAVALHNLHTRIAFTHACKTTTRAWPSLFFTSWGCTTTSTTRGMYCAIATAPKSILHYWYSCTSVITTSGIA